MLTQQSLMHQRLQQHAPQRIERSEEHTSELQSRLHLVCRLLLEKKKNHDRPAPAVRSPERLDRGAKCPLDPALSLAQTHPDGRIAAVVHLPQWDYVRCLAALLSP